MALVASRVLVSVEYMYAPVEGLFRYREVQGSRVRLPVLHLGWWDRSGLQKGKLGASSPCGGRNVRRVPPDVFAFMWAYSLVFEGVESVFTMQWAQGTAGFPQTLPLQVGVHHFWDSSCLHGGGELKASSPWGGRQLHPTFSHSGGHCLATRKGPSCGLFPVSADTAVLMWSRKYESEDAFAVSYGVTFSSVESGDRGTWLVLGPCSSDDTCAGEIP